MARKILFTSAFTILVSIALFMIFGILEKLASREDISSKIQVLPIKVPLLTMDSTLYSLQINRRIVLIYFNSECEHCQNELNEIEKSVNEFEGIDLVLMSSEQISKIKSISVSYNLANKNNFHFVHINPESLYANFGSLSVPHIFVYGADGKLRKEFKGETKIEAILSYARK
jgi:thioredoxin-related protein